MPFMCGPLQPEVPAVDLVEGAAVAVPAPVEATIGSSGSGTWLVATSFYLVLAWNICVHTPAVVCAQQPASQLWLTACFWKLMPRLVASGGDTTTLLFMAD
jgi:hypothetical protein